MDYAAFFSKTARLRKPSALRALYDGFRIDETYVVMAGGLPNPDIFPIKSMTLNLSDGSEAMIDIKDTNVGLQYGVTSGNSELRTYITDLIKRLHDPPCMRDSNHPGATEVLMTSGGQDGIYKTFELLLEEGDTLLTEEYIYPGMISAAQPIGCHIQTIHTDKHGIIIESLAAELSKWPKPDDGKPSLGKLKALYCVPNGGNPTGIRYSVDRKREIYRLAHDYNFLIVEDDPYFFLEERPLTESFLSMDVDGRVIRLESFSKTVAPGLRLGYVTVPRPIFTQLLYISQASTQGSSSLSQIVLLQLLRKWGQDGYLEHCKHVSDFYAKRRKICEEKVKKHLTGLAEWNAPSGGMFLWIKFTGISDSVPLIMDRLVKRKVLIVAGAAFSVDVRLPIPYARVSYSIVSLEEMDTGLAIIAEELRSLRSEQNK